MGDVDLNDKSIFDQHARKLADVFAHIECLDRMVKIFLIKDNFITAVDSSGECEAISCGECGSIYRFTYDVMESSYVDQSHPDNGCKFGMISNIMRS